jgi:hypothetical protein
MKPSNIDSAEFGRLRPSLVAAAFAACRSGDGMSLIRAFARDDFGLRLSESQAAEIARKVETLGAR